MTDFEKAFMEIAIRYEQNRGHAPKYIAVSYYYMDDFYKIAGTNVNFSFNLDGRSDEYIILGKPLKFVQRRNYMEAMPRRKPSRRKMSAMDIARMNLTYEI